MVTDSFLSLLDAHAARHSDVLVHVLPDRDITYRRLSSRIERAAARLQGEWGVRPGDTVAYAGAGHPDAIVLYFALLRIGAALLPLEAMAPADLRAAFDAHRATLAVHDDGLAPASLSSRPLSLLLADWCHHDPQWVADDPARRALWLPTDDGRWEALSLSELTVMLPAEPRPGWVQDRLFTRDVLVRLVLPSLRDARRIHFAATEPRQRTGS